MEAPQEDCWEIVDCRTDWETGHAWEIVKSSRKTLQILTPDSKLREPHGQNKAAKMNE